MNFDFIPSSTQTMLSQIFWTVGWIPLAAILLWGAKEIWLVYIRTQWAKTVNFIVLAIDIPRNNAQSPKAVENLLSYLAGAHFVPSVIEKYWVGVFQLSISLEIVSIDGYIQFLVYTPEKFRDLVESSFYSQYPDAEITEVNDYTGGIPQRYPDNEYNLYGCEFTYKTNSAYPIKTYKEFEHIFGEPETQFKDPMATLIDLYSSLRPGEQVWLQIILIPIDFSWVSIGDREIKKILKEKDDSSSNFVDTIFDTIMSWLSLFGDTLFGGDEDKKETKEEPLKMLMLKPKEKKQAEYIQLKTSKLGYEVKIRFIYSAKKELFNRAKVVSGMVGFMKQFADMDLNNLKPDMVKTATNASFFFKKAIIAGRQNRILQYYQQRNDTSGLSPIIMNIEELATLWHFPIEAVVKAPMVQKAPGRKAEAPVSLPVSEASGAVDLESIFGAGGAKKNRLSGQTAGLSASADNGAAGLEIFADTAPPDEKPAIVQTKKPDAKTADNSGDGLEIFADTAPPDEKPAIVQTKKPDAKTADIKAAPPENLPIG